MACVRKLDSASDPKKRILPSNEENQSLDYTNDEFDIFANKIVFELKQLPSCNVVRCKEKIVMIFNEESLLKQPCLKEIESVIIEQEPGFSEELCYENIETNIKIEPQEETLINDESLHIQEDINTRLIIKQEPGFSRSKLCDDNTEAKIKQEPS